MASDTGQSLGGPGLSRSSLCTASLAGCPLTKGGTREVGPCLEGAGWRASGLLVLSLVSPDGQHAELGKGQGDRELE